MAEFSYISPDLIIVDRENRQRQENLTTEDLEPSIRAYGILNPIIIDENHNLIAGERRLRTAKKLGLATVPVRYRSSLSPTEDAILELEENLRRKDLVWQDEVKAQMKIHDLYASTNPEWSLRQTADALNISHTAIHSARRVLQSWDDEKISKASSLSTAVGLLARRDQRAADSILTAITEQSLEVVTAKKPEPPTDISISDIVGTTPPTVPPSPQILPAESSLLNLNFIEWADAYSGPSFNFIHCDFPYGINVFKGEMSGKNEWETYDDSPEIYWALLACLCRNLNKLMSASGHIMFWFPFDHYTTTIAFLQKNAPSLAINPYPLFWGKSDNSGILPDAKRGPRRGYESALILSRGDRIIVRAVTNWYASPTDKSQHHSTKPEPMLRQFFSMFVDEFTRMLDPTCGSGSSLRAAESLKAEFVLGLELSPEHHKNACGALQKFRVLNAVSR